jgi:hypothetical protein
MVQFVKIEITNPLTYNFTIGRYNASSDEKIKEFMLIDQEVDYNNNRDHFDKIVRKLFVVDISLHSPPWASKGWAVRMPKEESLDFDQFKCEIKNGKAIISGTLLFKVSFKEDAYKDMVNEIDNLFISDFTLGVYLGEEGSNKIIYSFFGEDYKLYYDLVYKTWSQKKEIGPERKIKVTFGKKLKDLDVAK